ncbi:MAG: peptide chain release factor N(5)-glutamine methyltransferase [Planctomycetales bacterium]
MPPPDPTAADVWTVGRIIEWTTQHLRKSGSDTPRLEAEILLAQARGCPRIQLYVDFALPVSDAHRATMRDLVQRRARAEPVAYLVGHREFFGLDFLVNPDVLIPRPETETLVMELIALARRTASPDHSGPAGEPKVQAPRPLKILDLGTGSGCIAVASAAHLPQATVTAIDISPQALVMARQNASRHGVEDRLQFLEGDLFGPLGNETQFDLIASNPPYVSDSDMETLPADVRQHEPHLALRAGPRGLDVIERVVQGAPARLSPGGALLLEISPEQAAAVTELIAGQPPFAPPRILKDSAGRQRVVVARDRREPG